MSHVTATTDPYEVTMALSYVREGMRAPATFSLFAHDVPPGRGFLVAAGLEPVLDHLSRFLFGPAEARDFAEVLRRPPEDLDPLRGTSFDGQVRAVPEGRLVFAGEPLLEVTAPLAQVRLVQTYVMSLVRHQTAVASLAGRYVLAAAGRPVVDCSLSPEHGPEGAVQAARLRALVGFSGSGGAAASARNGIPASGTMTRGYVESFPSEEEAFRAFARAHQGPVTFSVGAYDTDRAVAAAVRVLSETGRGPGDGIRLDGGDTEALAHRVRALLDTAGLRDVRIVVGGEPDEYAIDALVRGGAPVDAFAVGPWAGTGGTPPLDAAFPLVEYDGRPVMMPSSAKAEVGAEEDVKAAAPAPAPKQVFRAAGHHDVIGLWNEEPPEGSEPLLRTVMRGGLRTEPPGTPDEARARFEADLAELPTTARRVEDPVAPVAAVSTRLAALTTIVRHRIGARTAPTDTRPPPPPG